MPLCTIDYDKKTINILNSYIGDKIWLKQATLIKQDRVD